MVDEFVPQLEVRLDGTELGEDAYDALVEVRAESSVQLPEQIVLSFLDPAFRLYDRDLFKMGGKLAVSITSEGMPQPVADAEITTIGMEPGSDGQMILTVTGLGLDHRLHRGIRLATYLDQTDSEVAQKIAQEAGLSADVDASAIRHPYLMQASTDHQFLAERARAIGFRWWVEDETLHFSEASPDTADDAEVGWGEDLISLRIVAASASARTGADVRSWDPDTQQAITGTASSTADLDLVGTDASGPLAAAAAARSLGNLNGFRGLTPVDDAESANALAGGVVKLAGADEVRLQGVVVGNPALRAGCALTITDIGDRLSGVYRLASVEHVYEAGRGYVTRFRTGGQEPSELVDLVGGARTRTESWDPHGLVIGVVSNIEDPDRPSRVKVRFPTFSDEFESAWARVAMPGAGKDRGLQLLPEIDDEVLVGFEHGDATRPIVLGGLWSKKLTPPLANADVVKDGVVARRSWKSRSGHEIAIHDAEDPDADRIVVSLADGKGTFTLGSDKVTLVTPVDIEITTEKSLSMTATGDVSIAGANVSVTADSKVELKGAQLSAAGSASAELKAPNVDIKASAKLAADGGGLAEIKGGLVKLN